MAYQINFFGHCAQENHDKVWGFVTCSDGELHNFWGRRGKRFAFQAHPNQTWATAEMLRKKAKEKTRSGRASGTYLEIPIADIETVWPGFYQDFEVQLVYAKLSDNFRAGSS